jgi:hypothetical protein
VPIDRVGVLVSFVVGAIVASATPAFALPSGNPTIPWPQTNGRVRVVEVVNETIYLGGLFTQATDAAGVTRDVDNLAAFDATSGRWAGFSVPRLNSDGAQVWDMQPLGDGVVVAGKFVVSSTQQHLMQVGPSGVQWFSQVPQPLKAVLVAPNGRVYAGGTSLAAWDAATKQRLWAGRSAVSINKSLRGHKTPAAYREMLWKDGVIYVACQCDALDGTLVKAMVRLDADGRHDPSFGPSDLSSNSGATGLALATDGTDLYLGAGGSDFFARYTTGGALVWKRDTSGSTQSVLIHEGLALIGGHFWYVGDESGDRCGFRSSSNPDALDPYGECQERRYLAAYELNGTLTPWGPRVTGKYNGVWDIDPQGSALHIGGEFTKVEGKWRKFYAKLA